MSHLTHSKGFAQLKLSGADHLSFCQRLVSIDIIGLQTGRCAFGLLLDAAGKIQTHFWILKRENALNFVGTENEIKMLKEKLQFYHFSETLHWDEIQPVEMSLSKEEVSELSNGMGALGENLLRCQWGHYQFVFNLESSKSSIPSSWALVRRQIVFPICSEDFSEPPLVFELGFQFFCAEKKGCYIGQEVVERVRSRGGDSPFKFCLLRSSFSPDFETALFEKNSALSIGTITDKNPQKSGDLFLSFGRLKTKFAKENAVLFAKNGQAVEIIKVSA